MLDRMAVGELPAKHHTALRGSDGALRWEECLTRDGFDGPYTILYHLHRPHEHRVVETSHGWEAPEPADIPQLRRRHFKTQQLPAPAGPACDVRVPLLFNDDVVVSLVQPDRADPVYVVNADADELFFLFEGSGTFRTPLGDLRAEALDYVCIPRGVPYRFLPDDGPHRWLAIECLGGLWLPTQWRNPVGQLRMDAPYSHRDFRRPVFRGPQADGVLGFLVKRNGRFTQLERVHEPLGVVGWDGTVYPWAFPILNFQPRAGLVHLPPDWHGTFAARGALVCSFVPRVVDFHPDAIPCPYPHSSVDCDEVLYYVRGNFTSRRGVGPGSISFHPAGIPHGPHPGAYEASIGTTRTDELAVMMDTLKPLVPTRAAGAIEDLDYDESFIG